MKRLTAAAVIVLGTIGIAAAPALADPPTTSTPSALCIPGNPPYLICLT